MFAKPSSVIIVLFAALFFFGCEADNDFTNKVAYAFHDKCGNQKAGCMVTLEDVVKDDWDKVYLFSAWTTSDSIAAKMKMSYLDEDVQDDYRRVIFTRGKNVVYQNDIRSYSYDDYCDIFADTDSLNSAPQPFFSKTNLFWLEATKEKASSSCPNCIAYILSPIKNKPLGNHK